MPYTEPYAYSFVVINKTQLNTQKIQLGFCRCFFIHQPWPDSVWFTDSYSQSDREAALARSIARQSTQVCMIL